MVGTPYKQVVHTVTPPCALHCVGVILIFPFIPFMVSDFFPKLDRTEIGKRAGFIGSAYYIGSLAGSFMVRYKGGWSLTHALQIFYASPSVQLI